MGFDKTASNWSLIFNISGHFLGITKVKAELQHKDEILVKKTLEVQVTRKKTIQSKLFSYSVAILVSLAYINMGCAIDLQVMKDTLKRPIGPMIGKYWVVPVPKWSNVHVHSSDLLGPLRQNILGKHDTYLYIFEILSEI